MLYRNVDDNMIYTVRVLGAILPEQICRFFSQSVEDADITNEQIKRHVSISDFGIDEESNRVFLNGAARYSPEVEENMERAIWILVNFGAEDVRDFFVGQGPTYIVFFSNDGTAYDISVVNSISDAQTAKMLRQRFSFGFEQDKIIHFAVVPDQDMARIAKGYGFDYVCLLDEDNQTEYYA